MEAQRAELTEDYLVSVRFWIWTQELSKLTLFTTYASSDFL